MIRMQAILGVHLNSDGSIWILKMHTAASCITVLICKMEVTLSSLAHSKVDAEIMFFIFALLLGFVLVILITVCSLSRDFPLYDQAFYYFFKKTVYFLVLNFV